MGLSWSSRAWVMVMVVARVEGVNFSWVILGCYGRRGRGSKNRWSVVVRVLDGSGHGIEKSSVQPLFFFARQHLRWRGMDR